jgi:hypothetical protein
MLKYLKKADSTLHVITGFTADNRTEHGAAVLYWAYIPKNTHIDPL